MNRKAMILIVDDEESKRYTTRMMLQSQGFHVTEATTGEEALRLADEQPDLIMLDLHLPDVAGVDICQTLKAAPRTAAIPVLHVTALYPGAAEKAESLAAGADGYLTRPLDQTQLLATINTVLARRAIMNVGGPEMAPHTPTFGAPRRSRGAPLKPVPTC